MSSSRVNRGNPSLVGVPSSASSSALRNSRAGGSYAGATGGRGGDWSASSPSAARAGGVSALKPQPNAAASPSSPNPYAPAFVASSASPWTTPSGGVGAAAGAGTRYKGRAGAARTLFPDGTTKAPGQGWEEQSESGVSESSAGTEESSSSLLRANNHPEHWESYDAASNPSSSLPSAANTEPASLNLTPFDSPSLGPYRSGDLAGEKLLLDERGTDISLSLMKKGDGTGDISIHMLSLLYDPPVQGCELKPYVSVVSVTHV
jgi:hypothetical protein